MRVLAVGDTHRDWTWLIKTVIPTARKQGCPRIIQVGDFGFVWSNNLRTAQTDLGALSGHLETACLTLTFLPGNHENHWMLSRLEAQARRDGRTGPEGHAELAPHVYYTGRYSAWEWAGVRIAAVGGATSIDRAERFLGEDWWPEEALTQAEARKARQLGPVDVLFSHDGPPGVPFTFLVPDLASQIHRQRVGTIAQSLRPTLWLHGHYHYYARYEFRHRRGMCQVIALNCNGRPDEESMHVVDLAELAA